MDALLANGVGGWVGGRKRGGKRLASREGGLLCRGSKL